MMSASWRSTIALGCCCLLLLLTTACGPDKNKLRGPNPGEANVAWHAFVARSMNAEANTGPFRASASLRYEDTQGESTRVSVIFWGNGGQASPYPLRLDLMAGIGSVVAKIREDAGSFLAYSPDEKVAYTHSRANSTLVSFGVPIPLSLGDLSLILTGRSSALFLPPGTDTNTAMPIDSGVTDRGTRFTLPGAPLPGIIEVAANGALLSWRELQPNGWVMEFTMQENNPLLPRRLKITHPRGYEALIVVKELDTLAETFPAHKLSLPLPGGTVTKPLGES